MNTFGGVPATIRLTSGLDPACSCGTAISVILLPCASNSLTITLSAPISLSFDHEWNSLSSVAAAVANGAAPIARASPSAVKSLLDVSLVDIVSSLIDC